MWLDNRWHKVMRDLWGNKLRTLFVVLAIAVGVFAFGMVGTSRTTILREMEAGWLASRPASAMMNISPFDDDLVRYVAGLRGVKEAQGRYEFTVSLQVGPDAWQTFHLFALPTFEDIPIATIAPESGSTLPRRREVLLERSDFQIPTFPQTNTLIIELDDGTRQELVVAGVVYDISLWPARNYSEGYGYITLETLEWLIGRRAYNRLYISLESAESRLQVERDVTVLRERIQDHGYTVYNTDVPRGHWASNVIGSITLVVGAVGTFSLILSGFLVINTTLAYLQQQLKQIGIMKAIGASSSQILGLYLVNVAAYGILAVFIAIPLGGLGAYAFTSILADRLNLVIRSFQVPLTVVAIQIAAGLIVPLVAALVPILNGALIPAREAIYDQQSTNTALRKGLIDRLIDGARGLPRPAMLSLRNTFRRKGRLVLTMGALTVAGAVFISVFSVRSSLQRLLHDVFALFSYDVDVDFAQDYRIEMMKREAFRIQGVTDVEAWNIGTARHIRPDGSEGTSLLICGVPPDTVMTIPTLIAGRWLEPGDANAIVLTEETLIRNEGIYLGGEIVMEVGNDEETLVIVGVVTPMAAPNQDGFAFVTDEFYQRHWSTPGNANRIVMLTRESSATYQQSVSRALQDHFKDTLNMRVTDSTATAVFQRGITANINIPTGVLLTMSMLLATVGGLGLASTMTLNVLERTREIGVMRAVGASNQTVWTIVVLEGVLISLFSSLLGCLLAYPVGRGLTTAFGMVFLGRPLDYTYSPMGAAGWTIFAIVLAIIASLLPARRAVGISVRESLAYE